MVLLDPAAPDRALYALGAAGVAILGLLPVGRIAVLRVRQLAAAGVGAGGAGARRCSVAG